MFMKNKKTLLTTLILFLVLIEASTLFLMYKSYSGKETNLDEVNLQENLTNEMFAIMLEQDDGTYKESSDNTWPTSGYTYNANMSGCIDVNGNKLDGVLTYDATNNIATVDTGNTSYCYLYFSLPIDNLYKLCKSYNNIYNCMLENYNSNLNNISNLTTEEVGEMYRYQGLADTVNNNYICFGVSNAEDCIGAEYKNGIFDESKYSKYMYRIIGITRNGNLKVIKKEALDTAMQWWSTNTVVVPWYSSTGDSSLIYPNINGSAFLTNSDYVSDTWNNKIELRDWKFGNVDYTDASQNGLGVFGIENSFQESVSAKIGLLYLHDHYLSLDNTTDCYMNSCLNSWLTLQNNDGPYAELASDYPPSGSDWSMTLAGDYYLNGRYSYYAWQPIGTRSSIAKEYSVRPVFYITSDVKLTGGDGSSSNPYIIG